MVQSNRPLRPKEAGELRPGNQNLAFEPPEPFVDVEKASEFLSLRPRRIMELARKGTLPAYPIGAGRRRVWRFRLSELASAIARNKVFASPQTQDEQYPRQSPAPQ